MTDWTTPADVRARVRRRWDDGTLLRACAAGDPFPVLDIPLRGPRPSEIGDDIVKVRDWASQLDASSHGGRSYELRHAPVGGRVIGRNDLPARALVTSYAQAWHLLGTQRDANRLVSLLSAADGEPVVQRWIADHPLRALEVADAWPQLIAAYRWLDDHRGRALYLRQISAPGVDTKFVDQHRSILAALLDVPATASGFVAGLRMRARPELLRLRADPSLPLFGPITDVTAPVEELRRLPGTVSQALIVENEITFLSVPVPAGGVVVWGKGFEVDRAGSLPWLRDAAVRYWGDLDTHGFAILDRLRAWLPQTTPVLMDRDTLLAHRERWVREPAPARSALPRLTDDEGALYADLVGDRYAERLRLEQERVDWVWALERLDI